MKTTVEDLNQLLAYLRPTFGWVALSRVKAALDTKITDNRKLETARYLGLISRDGQNIEITDDGRAYATAQDEDVKSELMAGRLASSALYLATVEWMYHSKKTEPTKTDVAEQWHKHHSDSLEGAQGSALTDGAVFFLRLAEAAGLGQYIGAGNNRPETKLKGDRSAIEKFFEKFVLNSQATGVPGGSTPPGGSNVDAPAALPANASPNTDVAQPVAHSASPAEQPSVKVQASPAIHINVEIHIAADATADTVAEIFKNMRKYVLNGPDESPEDAA